MGAGEQYLREGGGFSVLAGGGYCGEIGRRIVDSGGV